MAKPARLVLVSTVDIPVPEASALSVRRRDGQTRVLAVGDRTHALAAAVYADAQLGTWQVLDLASIEGWPPISGDSQFEGLTCDGASLVALMREDPAEVIVVDTSERRVVATIELAVPSWSALAGRWYDPSSRGDGVVLLRGGRLLLAKEKRPRALVEFGPAGTSPRGVSREDFLDADEPWDAPGGDVTFHALAAWKLRDTAKKRLRDISALAVTEDRELWLLSDKSQAAGRLDLRDPLPRAGGTIDALDKAYRLPKGSTKPEGAVALDADTVLIALDTPSTHDNAIIVRRPAADDTED